MDIYPKMKSKRFISIFGIAVMLILASVSTVLCEGKPSNARTFMPCPDEWLVDAKFFVDRGLIPSVLVIVETPEWGFRVGAVGRANLSSPGYPEPDMHYRVGGITRLMLTTIILQLERERKITLDDTIDKLLGEGLVPKGDKITLHDCLMMRSGLFDYTKSDTFKSNGKRSDGEYLPEEILFRVRESLMKESGTPDEMFNHSETGYLLVGMVVEAVEKKHLSQVFEERIFKPFVMEDSFFASTPDIPEPIARGYENMSGIPVDCTVYDPSTLGAGRAVVSTPFDTFRFFRELFENRNLLSQRSFRMMASLDNTQRMEDAFGLGMLERVSRRGTWRGSETAIRGYSVMAGHYMMGQAYILVFVNTGENSFTLEEIFRNMLRRISGCPGVMSPVNNATVKATNGVVRISFQSGFLYGDSYNIYVGNSRDSVLNATPEKLNGALLIELDGDTFHADLNKLKSGRRYYWRVEVFRRRPDNEMKNARLWRDQLVEKNKQMPRVPVPETERINSPVYSFIVK